MDVLELLYRAENAGLEVRVEGERLIVRGVSHLSELVQELGKKKREILDYFNVLRGRCHNPELQNQYLGGGTGTGLNPEENGGSGATLSAPSQQPGEAKAPSKMQCRPLVGAGFPSIPITVPPPEIVADDRPDPFAGFPYPASVPPNPIPNYLIPATGDGNYLIGCRLTERELALDPKAVADACLAAVTGQFTPWPEFVGKRD